MKEAFAWNPRWWSFQTKIQSSPRNLLAYRLCQVRSFSLCFEVVIIIIDKYYYYWQIIFRLIEFHFEIFHFSAALLIFYNNITYNMLLDVILPFHSKINIVELKSALSFHLTDNCWCTMKILEMIVHMLYMGKLPDIATQRATAIHRKLACLLKSHLGGMGKWSKGLKIQKERSKLTFVNLISDHSCGRFLETFIPI